MNYSDINNMKDKVYKN